MIDQKFIESLSAGMQAAAQIPAMQLGVVTQAVAALAKVAEVAHMIGMSQSEVAARGVTNFSDVDERSELVEKVLKNLQLRDFALQHIEHLLSTIRNEPNTP